MIGYGNYTPTSPAKRCVVPFILVLMAIYWLAACTNGSSPSSAPPPTDHVAATVLPENSYSVAGRTVYGARGGYEAALRLAIGYAELPRCDAGKRVDDEARVKACSDQAVVEQVLRAREVARNALAAAETVVRTPGIGNDVIQTTVVAADAALKAFVAISSSLAKEKR